MNRVAVITFTKSAITPVQVMFPHHIGHYRSLEYALTDIKLYKLTPLFK